jgi:hypothetical protein
MNNSTQIELGDEVTDTVTSFGGVVVAITHWLNGCRRMCVQPRAIGADGKMPESHTIDENQLVVTKKYAVPSQNTPKPEELARGTRTGGPRPDAQAWPSASGRI